LEVGQVKVIIQRLNPLEEIDFISLLPLFSYMVNLEKRSTNSVRHLEVGPLKAIIQRLNPIEAIDLSLCSLYFLINK
jgi:hypothetical protein